MRSAVVVVAEENGLHARPAAEFVAAVRAHAAAVTLRNATTGAGPEEGASIIGLLRLGMLRGHRIVVEVEGGDEEAALADLAGRLGTVVER